MTKFFLLAVIFLATNTFGQIVPDFGRATVPNKPAVTINSIDTTLRVLYVKKTSNHRLPAYYLNDILVNPTFFYSIDPNLIESINVHKDSLQIENVKYYGQIYLTTKKYYTPKLISLTELKDKYTILKREPAIFIVDGEIVTSDYDKYVVDENLLWQIIVDKVENEKENINLKFIKLLMKTEENMKKAKEFRIRGTEVALTE